MTLDCQKCGKPTTVPNPALEAAAGNSIRISDLQHQLKENESQRTEVTGYINQLNIQLHRWQLRLQTLKERQQKLQAELTASAVANSCPKSTCATAAKERQANTGINELATQ